MDGVTSRWVVGRHMNGLKDEGSTNGWVKKKEGGVSGCEGREAAGAKEQLGG